MNAFERAAELLARDPWCPDCGLRLQVEQPRADRLHPPRPGPDGEALYPVLRRCPRNAERPAFPLEPILGGDAGFKRICDFAQVTGYAPLSEALENDQANLSSG